MIIILEISRYDRIPIEEFTEEFSTNSRVYYNLRYLESLISTLEAQIRSREVQLDSFLYVYLGFQPRGLNRELTEKLFDKAYVDPKFFITKDGGFTYTRTTKLQMIEAGLLEEFNALHLNYTSLKNVHSKIIKVLQRSYRRTRVEGNESQLTEIPFQVIASRNRRFNTENENVVGIHKALCRCMEARKGYVLIQGDFPQIDGKGALNLYFRSSYTNNLMTALDDSYLVYKEIARWYPYLKAKNAYDEAIKNESFVDTSQYERIISTFQSEVIPFTNKEHRELYKVIALRTVYNSKSSPLLGEDIEIKKLSAALNAMPVYAATKHYALYLKKAGYPVIVKSLFGYERDILESNEFTFLSQLFNSPIQSTSSEILIFVIMKIISHFRENGISEDKIRLYLNRHDEPIFEIEESFFLEHYDIFNEISWIAIDGWRPFKIDWMVSHKYGVSIPEYTEKINKMVECPSYDQKPSRQFIPLALPRIMAFSKHELVTDQVIFVLSEFIGDFPEDNFIFGRFKDYRKIAFDAKISKLDGTSLSEQYILSVINAMIQPLENDIPMLIYVEGFSKLTHLIMDDKNVWITGESNDLEIINRCIIATVINHLDPSLVDETNQYWLKQADKIKGRLVKR